MRIRSTAKLFLIFMVVASLACTDRKSKTEDESLMTEPKWFTAICTHLCDEEKGKMLDIEKLKSHGVGIPYDTMQIEDLDSIRISFDFITSCCLDFDGDISLDFDTLKLKYFVPPGDTTLAPCDCICDYRMTYKIPKVKRSWNQIKIVHEEREI